MKRSKPRFILQIVQKITLVVLALVLLINIYILVMNIAFKKDLVKVFGFAQTIVITGSMEPAIKAGDFLIIREQKEYQAGDIVTYNWGESFVTHRILEIDGGQAVTKGDSNNIVDDPIPLSSIRGKVYIRIPGAGKIILFLKTSLGILIMVIIGFLLIELPYAWKRFKSKKKTV